MTKQNKDSSQPPKGIERRKTRRRNILATFSIFLVIPQKGIHRLMIHNISEEGIAFDFDIESEAPFDFPAKIGDSIDARLYINPSLYIPIQMKIVRIEKSGDGRRVGASFQNIKSENHQALLSFLKLLDSILDVLKLELNPV